MYDKIMAIDLSKDEGLNLVRLYSIIGLLEITKNANEHFHYAYDEYGTIVLAFDHYDPDLVDRINAAFVEIGANIVVKS